MVQNEASAKCRLQVVIKCTGWHTEASGSWQDMICHSRNSKPGGVWVKRSFAGWEEGERGALQAAFDCTEGEKQEWAGDQVERSLFIIDIEKWNFSKYLLWTAMNFLWARKNFKNILDPLIWKTLLWSIKMILDVVNIWKRNWRAQGKNGGNNVMKR